MTLRDARRYHRQSRLTEVGVEGQARLSAARAAVAHGGLAGEVQARYLAGAGLGEVVVPDGAIAASAAGVNSLVRVTVSDGVGAAAEHPSLPWVWTDPSAQAVGEGANAALLAIRRALFGP